MNVSSRLTSVLLFLAAALFAASPLLNPAFKGFDPNLFPVPQFEPPIQPVGFAFSIWGLIYAGLLIFTAHGMWQAWRSPAKQYSPAFHWPLIVSMAIGAGWLTVANLNTPLATVQILVMAVAAIVAATRLPADARGLAAVWPVGLYAGWLTAASAVSLGLMLAGYGVMGGEMAALLLLPLAAALAAWLQARFVRTVAYSAAVVWALLGVAVANWGEFASVAGLALLCAAALAWVAYRRRLGPQ